jgi:hypothetical protein
MSLPPVCWHVPTAQLLLVSGLWLLRSHFWKMVPVPFSAAAKAGALP